MDFICSGHNQTKNHNDEIYEIMLFLEKNSVKS